MAAAPNEILVLTKVGLLLDRLTDEPEMTAAQLAEQLDEPRSSVHRLLANLEQLGFVEPGRQRGSYRLGLRLFQLGNVVASRFDLRHLALPAMERVHAATGETVFLCVRRGREAVCIERIDGRRVQSLALRVGFALPLHAGAAPRVLLAGAPPAMWAQYIADGELERFTHTTPATAEELIPLLEEVRRSGISVSNEDVTLGIAALGVPVLDHRGDVVASISISGLASSILGPEAERIRSMLVDAGNEVSRQLGYTPPPITHKESALHA